MVVIILVVLSVIYKVAKAVCMVMTYNLRLVTCQGWYYRARGYRYLFFFSSYKKFLLSKDSDIVNRIRIVDCVLDYTWYYELKL